MIELSSQSWQSALIVRSPFDRRLDALEGALLGQAIGDALGLAVDGMSREAIRRRFGTIDRYRVLEDVGYVSDDTEQTVLLLSVLLRHGDDLDQTLQAFRRALQGWFLRVPWSAGRATLHACARLTLGFNASGRPSADNGAAMRAPAVALAFSRDAERRIYFGKALARVTHVDPRAVEGALYVAEVTIQCLDSERTVDRQRCVGRAMGVVRDARLKNALQRASAAADDERRYRELPRTGYVVDTVAAATAEFLRHGDEPQGAISAAVEGGGDANSIAAIVGGWVGALHGARELPEEWVETLEDGAYGRSHLLALARSVVTGEAPPELPVLSALGRSAMLGPLLLWHALYRRLPSSPQTPIGSSPRETLDMPRGILDELGPKEREEFDESGFDDPAREP